MEPYLQMSNHKRHPVVSCSRRAALLPVLALAAYASAEDFNFELALDFERQSLSTAIPLFGGFPPGSPISTVFEDRDIDTTGLSGTWYFTGANADTGPRSRAAFLSRASSLSFTWQRTDVSSSFEISPPPTLPPAGIAVPAAGTIIGFAPSALPLVTAIEGDEYAFGGRYVWADSGWFIFGGASFFEGDTGDNVGFSADTETFVLGTGLYLGDSTAIEVAVIQTQIDRRIGVFNSDDATDFALSFTHIGDVGASWQYGVDAALFTRDRSSADTSVSLRGSLYPNRSLAFGLDIETEVDAGFDTGTRYGVFGSWFITPNIEFEASYGTVDVDTPPGISSDLDVFSLGLLARF